jgi:DNA helicase-2/ATP-dependent DNA helicase PcrA
MVEEIIAVLPQLEPHRFLAAITYTNAAANVIRRRLHARVSLRRNVFVGTTHSFINRFILQPFGVVFQELPSDCIYCAIDVREIATKGGEKPLAPANLQGAISRITGNLLKKGVVPYDSMLQVALRLMSEKSIRDLVARRLQFMFVDEFQDTDTRQSVVFDELRKARHTRIYAVGDPEQYVMGFTYAQRGQPVREYAKIPFFAIETTANIEHLTENHRANDELVTFSNQFRGRLAQTAIKPKRDRASVLFIDSLDLPTVITQFRALSDGVERQEERLSRLYLGFSGKLFDSVRTQFDLVPVSNDSRKSPTILGDALELLAVAVGQSQSKCQDLYGLSRLEWRRVGISLLRGLLSGTWTSESFSEFVKGHFQIKSFGSREAAVGDGLQQLKASLSTGAGSSTGDERFSSIHRAKGLEADAVLVVAESPSELGKWLEVDQVKRSNDKQDKCRLGYVAFTRAREMLGIACLKPLSAEVRRALFDRGVSAIHVSR